MDFQEIRDDETRAYFEALFKERTVAAGDPVEEEEAERLLQVIEDVQRVTPDGRATTEVLLPGGKWALNLTGTTWAMFDALVSFALAALPDPTNVTKREALKAAWKLIGKLKGMLVKLDLGEQAVVEAVAALGGEHWRHADTPGVSLDQIGTFFDRPGKRAPRDVEAVLGRLVSKGVVVIVSDLEDGKTYRIAT